MIFESGNLQFRGLRWRIIYYHDISQILRMHNALVWHLSFLKEDIAIMRQITGGSDKLGYLCGAFLSHLKEGGAWLGRFKLHYCDS